jgi:hypothetical protein
MGKRKTFVPGEGPLPVGTATNGNGVAAGDAATTPAVARPSMEAIRVGLFVVVRVWCITLFCIGKE